MKDPNLMMYLSFVGFLHHPLLCKAKSTPNLDVAADEPTIAIVDTDAPTTIGIVGAGINTSVESRTNSF